MFYNFSSCIYLFSVRYLEIFAEKKISNSIDLKFRVVTYNTGFLLGKELRGQIKDDEKKEELSKYAQSMLLQTIFAALKSLPKVIILDLEIKYRGGTSDATTSSSHRTIVYTQKRLYSSVGNNTGWTDGLTDQRTDGRTRPLIEMRSRI